jgi:hypothetical protein
VIKLTSAPAVLIVHTGRQKNVRWPRLSITEPQERVKPIACDAEYHWLTPAISLIGPGLMVVMIRETRVAVACINRKKFSVLPIALQSRSGNWLCSQREAQQAPVSQPVPVASSYPGYIPKVPVSHQFVAPA